MQGTEAENIRSIVADLTENIPHMEAAAEALKATQDFYAYSKHVRDISSSLDSDLPEIQLDPLIKQFEKLLTSTVPKRRRSALKKHALSYADGMIEPDSPFGKLAHAELQLRKLEVVCLRENGKLGDGWVRTTQCSEQGLRQAENAWKTFFERIYGSPSSGNVIQRTPAQELGSYETHRTSVSEGRL